MAAGPDRGLGALLREVQLRLKRLERGDGLGGSRVSVGTISLGGLVELSAVEQDDGSVLVVGRRPGSQTTTVLGTLSVQEES